MIERYVLDAWAILALLQGEEPAAARVREVIETAQTSYTEVLISMINLGEVYYRVMKVQNEGIAEETLAQVLQLPIQAISVSDELVYAAARWKGRYAISYADAFAAALTQQKQARLVTGDPELYALQDILSIEKLR
jgi:predicted nucleic acid-binding protein